MEFATLCLSRLSLKHSMLIMTRNRNDVICQYNALWTLFSCEYQAENAYNEIARLPLVILFLEMLDARWTAQ